MDRKGKVDEGVIRKMNKTTHHRGPDHTGCITIEKSNTRLLMGVNRLRIIDHNQFSDQPFTLNQDYYLLFNGELYNHSEIRNSLIRKGIRFKTSSDTEVLYHFLIEYGKDELNRLNGMYSFVFVDIKRDEVTAARDPWGMKPLYFYEDDNHLIISSEIQAIIASGFAKKIFNSREIPHYLFYKYTSPGNTFYQDVFQLIKGSFRSYGINSKKINEKIFKSFAAPEENNVDKKTLVNTVEKLLIDSIITHNQADVPIGLFLSGGIDSTLLLALYHEYNELPQCFSIANKSSEKNFGTLDYHYSKKAVKHFNSKAYQLEVDNSILNDLDDLIDNTDHPVADGAMLLTYILSKQAKTHAGVVLSGAGADELFSGYNRHKAFYFYLKHYNKWIKIGKALSSIHQFFPSGSNSNLKKKFQLIRKFLHNIDIDPEITFNNFCGMQNIGDYNYQKSWPEVSEDSIISKNFSFALNNDRNNYLAEDILTISDRMTMRCGLEMRMPYLDMNLANYVCTIKPQILIKYGRKWILKEILKKYTGGAFINRPKEGFGIPFGHWIKKPKNNYLIEEILRHDNPLFAWIDKNPVESLICDHLKSKADFTQEIWGLLILTKWIQKHF